MKMRIGFGVVLLLAVASVAQGQSQFPPPAGPVAICGVQAQPAADSHKVIVDGGSPEDVTVVANPPGCPSGTSGFTLPASRFTVGKHSIVVQSINTFGTTTGPAYLVTVGIAPGTFTVTAVVAGG